MRGRLWVAVAAGLIMSAPAWAADARDGTLQGGPAIAETETQGDWTVALGGGVGLAPEYVGDDDYETLFVPYVDIRWKDTLFLSTRKGLGAQIEVADGLKAGAALTYLRGREQDDSADLIGLREIDDSVGGQLFLEYAYGPIVADVSVTRDLGDGTDGTKAEAGLGFRALLLDGRLRALLRGSLSWADDEQNGAYFSVSAAEALASGLPVYTAGGGLRDIGLSANALYSLSDTWSLGAIASVAWLQEDAADSSLVRLRGDEQQAFVGLFAAYSF